MFALRPAFGVLVLCLASMPLPRAWAGEPAQLTEFFGSLGLPEGRVEFSNGFDATGHAWAAYASAVVGLSGPLHRDGWRLKLSGLYGRNSYETRSTYCQLSAEEKKQLTGSNFSDICNDIAGDPPQGEERDHIAEVIAPFNLQLEGDQIFATVQHLETRYEGGIAPGYQATLGALILKAYLGLAYRQHDVLPTDVTRSLQGGYWGAQSWLEAWLPLSDDSWLSADASYFTGTSSYSAAGKYGYRPASWLTLGPELSVYGDADDMSGRAGAFLRFNASGVETTIAAGFSSADKDDAGAYGSAIVFMRF
jgi:hypothetical protein